jgi:hypothetical protein
MEAQLQPPCIKSGLTRKSMFFKLSNCSMAPQALCRLIRCALEIERVSHLCVTQTSHLLTLLHHITFRCCITSITFPTHRGWWDSPPMRPWELAIIGEFHSWSKRLPNSFQRFGATKFFIPAQSRPWRYSQGGLRDRFKNQKWIFQDGHFARAPVASCLSMHLSAQELSATDDAHGRFTIAGLTPR